MSAWGTALKKSPSTTSQRETLTRSSAGDDAAAIRTAIGSVRPTCGGLTPRGCAAFCLKPCTGNRPGPFLYLIKADQSAAGAPTRAKLTEGQTT
jgi:hypothetical protein